MPEDACRFRVLDVPLASTLADAGALLVDRDPDVEIASLAGLRADAGCAIVPVDAAVTEGWPRPLRAAQRVTGSFLVRARASAMRRALERRGYAADLFAWDLEQLLRRPGERNGAAPLPAVGLFPLHAVAIGRRTPSRTVLEAVAEAAGARTGSSPGFGLPRITQGKVIAVGTGGTLRVAIGPAHRQLERAHAALDALASAAPPPEVTRLVPWSLARGSLGLATWSLETTLPGERVPPAVGARLSERCVEFLAELHPLARDGAGARPLSEDAEVIAVAAGRAGGAWLPAFAAAVEERLSDLPRGFGHGDFWSGNLLTDGGELTGVVDWDAAGPGRLPLLDLLHLRLSAHRSRTRELLGPGLVSFLLPWARGGGDSLTRTYCRRLGLKLGARSLEDLVAAYWIDRIAHELEMYADRVRRPFWMAQNVHRVLAVLAAGSWPAS